ncbi:unnamed protein product [Brassica oleracea]
MGQAFKKLHFTRQDDDSLGEQGHQSGGVVLSHFHDKKQKKDKMKRFNELRSFSHAVSDQKKKKTPNQESSKKKVFPSRLTMSWLGQGKDNNKKEVPQDQDPRRDSTSAFIP